MQNLRQVNEQRNGMNREHQGTDRKGQDAERRDPGLVSYQVNERPGRHLAGHGTDGADAERDADGGLRPTLAAEVDRYERPEAGLNVGDEQIEPIQAAARRDLRRLHRRGSCRGRIIGDSRHSFRTRGRRGRRRVRLHQSLRTRAVAVLGGGFQFVATHAQQHRSIVAIWVETQQAPIHGDALIAHA